MVGEGGSEDVGDKQSWGSGQVQERVLSLSHCVWVGGWVGRWVDVSQALLKYNQQRKIVHQEEDVV